MAAVGKPVLVPVLVLVLGLLLSAHCELRARDPEVEQEEEEMGGRRAGGGGATFPPYPKNLPHAATEPPPAGDGGSVPTRTG